MGLTLFQIDHVQCKQVVMSSKHEKSAYKLETYYMIFIPLYEEMCTLASTPIEYQAKGYKEMQCHFCSANCMWIYTGTIAHVYTLKSM